MDNVESKLIPLTKGQKTIPPTELSISVAKALLDIQASNSELAGELRLLHIRGAREVELSGGRKAIVILVPLPELKVWRRIQTRVLRELEKKVGAGGERSVLLVAHRRIEAKPTRSSMKVRARSHTLTFVHDAWLEDMVYPTEIVGKRIRVKTDGSRLYKVFLDAKDQTTLEGKTEVMSAVYRKLTGKNVVFEFPIVAAEDEPRRK